MIYDEVNKFLSRPAAQGSGNAISNTFLIDLDRIAHERPINLLDLKRNSKAERLNQGKRTGADETVSGLS